MTIVFIPTLISLLESKEIESGDELTQNEVERIRDNATVVEVPTEIANHITLNRGYPDLNAEDAWNEWLIYKKNKQL